MSLNESRVKIRGIYSTALTKLLLDNDFKIVEPSPAIGERFKLSKALEEPDLLINDRLDKQGIRVFGKSESIDALRAFLQESFDDVITRKWTVSINGIYKGIIKGIDEETGSVLVDIGPAVGIIPSHEKVDISKSDLLVQVEGKHVGGKHPYLTSQIKILGKFAIVVLSKKVGVSFRIVDNQKRNELYALGRELSNPHWGIIWRSTAVVESRIILRNEVKTLIEEGESVLEKAVTSVAPVLLREGVCFMDVEFPALSKQGLDKLRSSVAPTLSGHHLYKTFSGRIAAELELAEKMLETDESKEKVEESFREAIETEHLTVGSIITVQHVKLGGKVFNLGEAVLEEFNDSEIRFRRIFHSAGVYDGLAVPKEPEDYAVTETSIGAWHTKTDYYSKSGQYKGTYININTPVEAYRDSIRYVDLEVDLCILPNGTPQVVDMEKLEQAFLKGFISKRLLESIRRKVALLEKYGAM